MDNNTKRVKPKKETPVKLRKSTYDNNMRINKTVQTYHSYFCYK